MKRNKNFGLRNKSNNYRHSFSASQCFFVVFLVVILGCVFANSTVLAEDITLTWSTFIGGSSGDYAYSITVDSSGDTYITGETWSPDFPTSVGVFDTGHNGNRDVFVTKLNSNGTALEYSTYLGGSGWDRGRSIIIDPNGFAYVTGITGSSDFPTTSGAFDESYNGGILDAFVIKLNPTGTALEYSTYLGTGSYYGDQGHGIAIDANECAYVTGGTYGGWGFPTTPGAFDQNPNGYWDAFVTKLDPNGATLEYSTLLGGPGSDQGFAIAVDSNSCAYVTGYAEWSGFPTTPNAFDTTHNGGYINPFVTKLNATGTALEYSTYLGGSSSRGDIGLNIAVDSSKSAYVTGLAGSPDFPTTTGAYDETHNGNRDIFITKINPAGSALEYSTFLGGSNDEGDPWPDLAIDFSGCVYVTGYTESSDFPTTTGAFDETYNGSGDAFIAKLNSTGTTLEYSTFLGGSNKDYAEAIALGLTGGIYVAGTTSSVDFPATANVFDASHDGSDTAFVTALNLPTMTETSSSESSMTETLVRQKADMYNIEVTGDFNSVLIFTDFEIVSIVTGSWAGKGFSTGQWETTLEGINYTGNWQGVVFSRLDEEKIYLKGSVSGQLSGTVEGYLSESVAGTGIYDNYQATWKCNIGATSVNLNLNGPVTYQSESEFPDTNFYILQIAVDGNVSGDYAGALSTVINHVRITDTNNPYDGQGFSIISYMSETGSGQGWTYDKLVSPGIVELKGMFDSPLFGIANGVLDESEPPRTLMLTIRRVDLGLPPAPDLKVKTWGPTRVSPGQTFNYVLEICNRGLVGANNVFVDKKLSSLLTFTDATIGHFYDEKKHSVFWRIEELPPQSKINLFIRVVVVWGIPMGAVIEDPARVKHYSQLSNTYYPGIIWPSEDIDTWNDRYSSSNNLDSTLRRSYLGTNWLDGSFHTWLASIGAATEENYLAYTEGDGNHVIGFSHSGGTQSLYKKIDTGAVQVDYAVFAAPALLTQQKVENLVTTGKIRKAIVVQSPRDILNQLRIRIEREHEFGIWPFSDKRPAVTVIEAPANLDWIMKNFPQDMSDLLSENNIEAGILPDSEEFWIGGKSRTEQGLFENRDVDGDGIDDVITITGEFSAWTDVHDALRKLVEELFQNGEYPFDGSFEGLKKNEYPESQTSAFNSIVATAHDPSVKYGPEGRVLPGQQLNYTVEYENEGEGIAFGVYFTDTLDEDLDDSTLEIGQVIDVNDGSVISGPGIYNPATRTITWFAGEVGPSEGGFADLSINVKADANDGTEIINFATIYFPSVPEETRTNGIVSIVSLNQPPSANAGDNQTAFVGTECTAEVTLDGSDSNDPDGDPITYVWSWSIDGNSYDANGVSPTVHLPVGEYIIQLIVNDGTIDSEPDQVILTVLDNTPPELTVSVTPNTLWPPNHKMVLITPAITISDNCDEFPTATLLNITMNEGEETDTFDPEYDYIQGDGHTLGDIQVDSNGNIYLRAERSGKGNGRVYTIIYKATDDAGNETQATATVTVPHSQP